jgi:iron complex transport system substrate-binding protein
MDAPIVAGPMWISEMIRLAGGQDVFEDVSRQPAFDARQVNIEDIVRRDPEVIVASWCGKPVNREVIQTRPGMFQVAAVKNDRIFEVDGGAFLQPGPSIIHGISILERILHPTATTAPVTVDFA